MTEQWIIETSAGDVPMSGTYADVREYARTHHVGSTITPDWESHANAAMALTRPALVAGVKFVNGSQLHAPAFDWAITLTIVSVPDRGAIIVSDCHGRHGRAY